MLRLSLHLYIYIVVIVMAACCCDGQRSNDAHARALISSWFQLNFTTAFNMYMFRRVTPERIAVEMS